MFIWRSINLSLLLLAQKLENIEEHHIAELPVINKHHRTTYLQYITNIKFSWTNYQDLDFKAFQAKENSGSWFKFNQT